jgi:hypothetical protein
VQAKVSRALRHALLDDVNRNKDIRADFIELNFQSHGFPIQKAFFIFVDNIIIDPVYIKFVGYNLRISYHRQFIICLFTNNISCIMCRYV